MTEQQYPDPSRTAYRPIGYPVRQSSAVGAVAGWMPAIRAALRSAVPRSGRPGRRRSLTVRGNSSHAVCRGPAIFPRRY
jgi:hypothetical protein